MKPIVIISGPVGAGKTTVSKHLVEISPSPIALIEGDKFWSFIAKVQGAPVVEKTFRMIMRSVVAAAIPYALNGFETFVDFSMPPWFLPTALKMAEYREIPLRYVVLRPAMEICAERAANRLEGVISDYSNYTDLYNSFNSAESNIFSGDYSSAQSTASCIRSQLDQGLFKVV